LKKVDTAVCVKKS